MLKSFSNLCRAFNIVTTCRVRYNSNETIQSVRSIYKGREKKIDGFALFLLVIPVSTFGLGTWQVQRKKWKENLIAELTARAKIPPVDLPYDLSELSSMEFHPVRVVGTFDHSKEIYMGPRSLLQEGESTSSGRTIISQGQTGYLVVTPFKLADRDISILVNRGWVAQKQKLPHTRPNGQIQGETELVGVVRLGEHRQPFTPQNSPATGQWFYRDLEKMADLAGSEQVFLDAREESTIPGGPIGGQTRASLRNEHLSYILTWYTLSGLTAFMWYRNFISKVKVA